MAHTKGPWYVDEENGLIKKEGGLDWIKDKPIAQVRYGIGIDDEDNARLIAAAPDLLEALEAINEWCGTDHAAQALPFEPPWYQQLRAAIAKAKGEAPNE